MKDAIALAVLTVALSAAVTTDLRSNRISNVLVVTGLACAVVLAGVDGWRSLGLAAAGFAIGLILFLPAYVLAVMGAGDVKLMAMVGAFLGPADTVVAVVATIIAGGVLGTALVIARGSAMATFRRYWLMLSCLLRTGRFAYVKPAAHEAARDKMPYALAISSGTLWALWSSGTFAQLSIAGAVLP